MPRFLRPCLTCGALTRNGSSLCDTHTTTTARGYGTTWQRQAAQKIAAHRAAHGNWCPGWNTPSHPATDLVVDHDVGVLCRGCNSRKANLADKPRRRTPRVG